MPDAPDPLGRRALFWAPAQRREDDPRRPDPRPDRGRHALFSDPAVSPVDDVAGSAVTDLGAGGRAGHPSNRRPPSPPPRAERPRRGGLPLDELERPVGSGMFGSLTLQCSSCRVRSQVDLIDYVVLHLPLWFWRPGRGYTRFMTCPACRRRTWVSVTWTSRGR
ncbi:MAG TPA: hypothetical protein VMF60_09425 [Acidimicrobiales bacterium]|nr:hypothetical protein [Acidimicrobiales bacterium]